MGSPTPSCLLISGRIKVDVIREPWGEIRIPPPRAVWV